MEKSASLHAFVLTSIQRTAAARTTGLTLSLLVANNAYIYII